MVPIENFAFQCIETFKLSNIRKIVFLVLTFLISFCYFFREDCKSVAIGGGIIRRSLIYPECSKLSECYNLCITFTEDIHTDSIFNAYSIVINGNNLSSEDIEQQLIEVFPPILMIHSILENFSLKIKL